MLGGQQIPAYKTLMKAPRHLPRRTKDDDNLYRVIAWGAVIVLAVGIAAIVVAYFIRYSFSSAPLFLAVVPIGLVLSFCWWYTEVAPVASRWVVAFVAVLGATGCLLCLWEQSIWAQVQLALLIIYQAAVFRTAWQQLRVGLGDDNSS